MNTYQAELYHHDIKGQHWGIRRFQREDGTLTRAGQARYAVKEAANTIKDYQNALSDTVKDLPKKMKDPKALAKTAIHGQSVAKKVLLSIGVTGATTIGSHLLERAHSRAYNKGNEKAANGYRVASKVVAEIGHLSAFVMNLAGG